jgi:hypothetical protein
MKNAFYLTLLCGLTLTSTAQAQFAFKTAEGKTISSKSAPDTSVPYGTEKKEAYFIWEKDHVRIFYVTKYEDDILKIEDTRLYYDDFDPKTVDQSMISEGVSCIIFIAKPKKTPEYTYYKASTRGYMVESFMILFPSKKATEEFLTKVMDKKLEMSLDLDYTPPAKLVIEGKYEFPPKDEAPKPAPKRVSANFYVTLVNDSKEEIHVLYQEKPDSNSVRSIIISAGSYKIEKVIDGSQIFWRNPKRLALTIKRSMEDTRVILAK